MFHVCFNSQVGDIWWYLDIDRFSGPQSGNNSTINFERCILQCYVHLAGSKRPINISNIAEISICQAVMGFIILFHGIKWWCTWNHYDRYVFCTGPCNAAYSTKITYSVPWCFITPGCANYSLTLTLPREVLISHVALGAFIVPIIWSYAVDTFVLCSAIGEVCASCDFLMHL